MRRFSASLEIRKIRALPAGRLRAFATGGPERGRLGHREGQLGHREGQFPETNFFLSNF